MTRSSSPASRTRSVASSCWAREIVVVVTRQPVVARRVDRHPAPAGADLQQVVVGAEVEALADPVELRQLRLLEARVRAREVGARVHHRRIEEGGEEVVAEVVVGADVGAGAGAGVLGDEAAEPVQGAARLGDGGADAAVLVGEAAGGDPDQRDQVVGLPEPVDVALAEPDEPCSGPRQAAGSLIGRWRGARRRSRRRRGRGRPRRPRSGRRGCGVSAARPRCGQPRPSRGEPPRRSLGVGVVAGALQLQAQPTARRSWRRPAATSPGSGRAVPAIRGRLSSRRRSERVASKVLSRGRRRGGATRCGPEALAGLGGAEG